MTEHVAAIQDLATANPAGCSTVPVGCGYAYSAGGPCAIACALAFPERSTFVGIVSGWDPAENPTRSRWDGKDNLVRSI